MNRLSHHLNERTKLLMCIKNQRRVIKHLHRQATDQLRVLGGYLAQEAPIKSQTHPHAGSHLIEAVADHLHIHNGVTPKDLQKVIRMNATTRAIRYAVAELIRTGRAKRKGQQGPVFAVKSAAHSEEDAVAFEPEA